MKYEDCEKHVDIKYLGLKVSYTPEFMVYDQVSSSKNDFKVCVCVYIYNPILSQHFSGVFRA